MLATVLFLATAAATHNCGLRKFENLVTFGDSFTDDAQGQYFLESEDYPPPGTKHEGSNHTSSGGYAWGRIVTQTTDVIYNNYALQGAFCTNEINEREIIEGVPFPDVIDYQVPLFEADLSFEDLYPNRKEDNTAYALCIGANDLGFNSFFRNQNNEGTDLTTVSDCMMEVFDRVYATGGRYFILISTWNLEDTPLYTSIPDGGMEFSRLWENKTEYNTVEEQGKLETYVSALKDLSAKSVELGMLKKRWPGSTFAFFDIHALFEDIMASPEEYFEAPADVKGVYSFCESDEEWENKTCSLKEEPMAGFMWFDQLHPSERTCKFTQSYARHSS